MHHPTDRIAHTTAFVTPVVEHWTERDPVRSSAHGAMGRLIDPSWWIPKCFFCGRCWVGGVFFAGFCLLLFFFVCFLCVCGFFFF